MKSEGAIAAIRTAFQSLPDGQFRGQSRRARVYV